MSHCRLTVLYNELPVASHKDTLIASKLGDTDVTIRNIVCMVKPLIALARFSLPARNKESTPSSDQVPFIFVLGPCMSQKVPLFYMMQCNRAVK